MSSIPADRLREHGASHPPPAAEIAQTVRADEAPSLAPAAEPLTVLIVVPTLDFGAADTGALELVRILAAAGHHPIVASRGGRLVPHLIDAGGEFVRFNMASKNPLVMLHNAIRLTRLAHRRHCDVIHAYGRAPAWSAYIAARLTGRLFLTTWHKGFREQNAFKRMYNSIMARGDRVIAVSEQIAELINDRYGTPWERISIVPASIDLERFDPLHLAPERIDAVRRRWGVKPGTKVILVVGRILRRKGHHVVVRAARRLKQMGLKDFLFVFVGEDREGSRYTGELWDQVLATDTVDVIRMAPADDLPAAYAAAAVVVSAAVGPEGMQRAILEAQAMARPVIVSDLGAGPEVVLAPPTVPEDRMTGLRFAAGDDAALTAALLRLLSWPEQTRQAIGLRGRDWVVGHFNAPAVAEQTLALYAQLGRRQGRS